MLLIIMNYNAVLAIIFYNNYILSLIVSTYYIIITIPVNYYVYFSISLHRVNIFRWGYRNIFVQIITLLIRYWLAFNYL